MNWLTRAVGLRSASPAERRATLWTAAMFGACMTSTFVLRPLRDQFGVEQGVARMPWLYLLTLLATAAFTPVFWWLADRRPSRRFVPLALQACAASMVLLFIGLWSVGSYDWRHVPWLGEAFWGWFSAMNVAVPTLVWIHAVEFFRREQGLRLFGIVGVGGTLGTIVGSWLAGRLAAAGFDPCVAALAAFGCLQVAWLCHRRAVQAATAMANAGPAPTPEVATRGGMFEGLQLLVRSRRLAAIAGYMVLLAMMATAFAVAQTGIVGRDIVGARAQHGWLAHQETINQSLVLVLQLFCTGRLLGRFAPAVFLSLLPVLSMAGLCALSLWPTVTAVAVVQCARRGVQFALEKPSREVLYTPLDLATKHKVKFVLDTFAFRLGDLLGALFQVWVLTADPRSDMGWATLPGTAALALSWAALGVWLGRQSRPGIT